VKLASPAGSVDSSISRIELKAKGSFRRTVQLRLNGHRI